MGEDEEPAGLQGRGRQRRDAPLRGSASPDCVSAEPLKFKGPISALLTAVTVLFLDQMSKQWALHALAGGSRHVLGPLNLSLAFNTGSAFSLRWAPPWLVVVTAVVIICAMIAASFYTRSAPKSVAFGLVIGGAAGNVSDRLIRAGHGGAVVDFIALRFWPTFNVADSCIVVGLVLVAIEMWFGPSRGATSAQTSRVSSGAQVDRGVPRPPSPDRP